jgi:UDP-N-acetylmuramoyl-tripeptide--D-alanyl-D-alanine ligase
MTRTLAAVATQVQGRLIGADRGFGDVSTDTRTLGSGALFVAIVGERFDGNDFIAEAHSKGASGALVSRAASVPLPQIEVGDTRRALGGMARAWRENFDIPVVAVTGSAGKTTVKELIAAILGQRRRICVTRGNLNNDIGVPLTLLGLDADDKALVVELGANHAGEIGYLSALAEPTVGVITLAGAAHLEGFGSIAGVAAAKGELLDHLPRAGTAVLNADDPFCGDWRSRTRSDSVLTFGLAASADCSVVGEPTLGPVGSSFQMRLPDGSEIAVDLPLAGIKNVVNALAAAAAAFAVGAPAEDIRSGLEHAVAVRGRMTLLNGIGGASIVDDSYNANPASVRAALDYLAELPGRRVFVLGDMGELGSDAEALHRDVGRYARDRCDRFFAIGPLAALAAEAFGSGGRGFADIAAAEAAISELLGPDLCVLVKGSRLTGLERLVARLVDPATSRSASC